MTVSVEDKVELFKNIIFQDIEDSSSAIRNKAAEDLEREKRRLNEEVELKRKQSIAEAEKKAEKEKQQLIAKAKSQVYYQLLGQKQQFINETIELLLKEAKSFVNSEGYARYLSESLSKAASVFQDTDSIHLYFTNRDLTTQKELLSKCIAITDLSGKCSLEEAGKNIIGGFYAEDGKREIQVDYTLKSLIEENRERIGSYINRRLDEVQGNEK